MLLTWSIFFRVFFQFIQKGELYLQANCTSWYCQLLQWFAGLGSHAGSLFFSPVVSGAATSLPLGRSGDNLALAPLPLAVLSGVLPVVVISSKLEVVLIPRDLSGVLYKKIALLQAWPKNPPGNPVKRAKKKHLILNLVKARTKEFSTGLVVTPLLRKIKTLIWVGEVTFLCHLICHLKTLSRSKFDLEILFGTENENVWFRKFWS